MPHQIHDAVKDAYGIYDPTRFMRLGMGGLFPSLMPGGLMGMGGMGALGYGNMGFGGLNGLGMNGLPYWSGGGLDLMGPYGPWG